jgi:hypothetical protein
MEVRLEKIAKLKVGTVIQHKNTHRVAKITDAYYPPDNPFVISVTYKYVDTDVGRTIIDGTLERFNENWDILDTEPTKKEQISV